MSNETLLEYIDVYNKRKSIGLYEFEPYKKQAYASSLLGSHDYVCLSALNQGGKTVLSAAIVAQHATGEYQQWFKDSGAPLIPDCKLIWCVSVTPSTIQAGLTRKLLGKNTYDEVINAYNSDEWEGMLPKDLIVQIKRETGTDRVGHVLVKNINGQTVKVELLHCSKEVTSFQAEANLDFLAVDEGIPVKYWNEIMPRQTHGCNGFYGFITMTPHLDAPSDFIDHVFEREEEKSWAGNAVCKITIDDVPDEVISRSQKDKLIEKTKEKQKPARLYGEPIGSGGLIFETRSHDITIPRSQFAKLLAHRPFLRISGMDFGFNDPMTLVSIHIDAGTGAVYLDREFKQTEMTASEFAGHLRTCNFDVGYPISWPHDGVVRNKREDKRPFVKGFSDAKMNMLSENVKRPAKEMHKIAGWWDIEDKAKQRLFFIVDDCYQICHEWDSVKLNPETNKAQGQDHLLDALYCAWQMRHLAKRLGYNKNTPINLNRRNAQASALGIPNHLTW